MYDNLEEAVEYILQLPASVWSQGDWNRLAMLLLYFQVASLAKRVDQLAQFLNCPLPQNLQHERQLLHPVIVRHLAAGTPFEQMLAAILDKPSQA
ncbi:MAG: hypothetical protein HYY14_05755 [Candidatus Omnitrophica bacterium]|nr:hypothetical protein [Candidatus Omnitrophota bacterium]